jgi:Flp pilus assembly pilin Flp
MIAGRPRRESAVHAGRSGARAAISRAFRRFVADETAPTSVEYALLVAGIFAVIVGAVWFFGGRVENSINRTAGAVRNAVGNN